MPLPVDVAPLAVSSSPIRTAASPSRNSTAPSNPYWGTKLWIDHKLAMLVNEAPFAGLVVANPNRS